MTPKQQRFVEEYAIDQNATQAAIRAGYSENGVGQTAHNLLKNTDIKRAIDQRLNDHAENCGITAEFVLNGLKAEATYYGEGATHSARVQAHNSLAKHLGLFGEGGAVSPTSKRFTVVFEDE